MADVETVRQNFLKAKEDLNAYLKANPVRFIERRGLNFCYIKVMKPSKDDPSIFVEAYEIPLYVPGKRRVKIEKAGE